MTSPIATALDRALRRLRPPRRSRTMGEGSATRQDLPGGMIGAAGDPDDLPAGLKALDSLDALLIRAAFLNGLTYAELARRTGMPLATVKTRIRGALPRLRPPVQRAADEQDRTG